MSTLIYGVFVAALLIILVLAVAGAVDYIIDSVKIFFSAVKRFRKRDNQKVD